MTNKIVGYYQVSEDGEKFFVADNDAVVITRKDNFPYHPNGYIIKPMNFLNLLQLIIRGKKLVIDKEGLETFNKCFYEFTVMLIGENVYALQGMKENDFVDIGIDTIKLNLN